MNNPLPYNAGLKNLRFEEVNFTSIGITIPGLVYDQQTKPQPDTWKFKDMLLDACSAEIGAKVLKLNLFVTPGQPDFNGLGFLYLEDKIILPIKLQENSNLKFWTDHLTKDKNDWLLCYSKDEYKMEGMAHEWKGVSYNIKDKEIYKETGKYLFENSPREFNKEETTAEKAKYIRKFINTNGPQPDPPAITKSFNDLVKISGGKMFPPVQSNFEEFKKLSGYELPAELKIIFSISNGATFFPDRICVYQLLSFESLMAEWKQWKSIYDEWILSALKSCAESDGEKTLPMYTTPYWVPFLTSRSGNFVAIDYAPDKNGQAGQIIVFGADESKIKVLAPDLNVFLKLFAAKDESLGLIDEQPEEE